MGIYIKGLEMPMSCRQCSLYLQSMDSERNVYESCAVTAKSYNWGLTTRPSDCPLIEIPPHGRLIDADALMKMCGMENDCYNCPNGSHGWCTRSQDAANICEAIEDAPTVIPAEEGE